MSTVSFSMRSAGTRAFRSVFFSVTGSNWSPSLQDSSSEISSDELSSPESSSASDCVEKALRGRIRFTSTSDSTSDCVRASTVGDVSRVRVRRSLNGDWLRARAEAASSSSSLPAYEDDRARAFSLPLSFVVDLPRSSLFRDNDRAESPPIIEDKDILEKEPLLRESPLPFETCWVGGGCCGCCEDVRSSALRMICEACWSSSSLVSKDVVDDHRRLVGVWGRETAVSSEVEELERLKGRPPPRGVWVDELEALEVVDPAVLGRSYESSSRPSCGVGRPAVDESRSLYLPIQLRFRGASGLEGRSAMVVVGVRGVRRRRE